MVKHLLNPKDFIKNYSSNNQAELLFWVVDEHPSRTLRGWLRAMWRLLLGKGDKSDTNDQEAEQAWRTMESRWGNTNSDTVIQYLVQKFDGIDHLRKFEYAFLARCLCNPNICKNVIVDVGGGNSYSTVVPILLRIPDAQILSVDVVNHPNQSKYGVQYVQGDCMNTNLADESVDFVAFISTLEHVGLGRWGDPLDVDGDIKAMQEVWRILKPGGHVVLTIPYGYPTVVFNLNRIYDAGRVLALTKGFEVLLAEYSVNGQSCTREDVEGKKTTKFVPGYYRNVPKFRRHPDAQGGALFLLRRN